MTKKQAPTPLPPLEPPFEHPPHLETDEAPVPHSTEPHTVVTSPAAEQLNDRMALAAKPNDGEPLAHRSRSKAGRKG